MASPDRIVSTGSETQKRSLARIAQEYFIQASMDYPASVPAQAVSIALAARKSGHDVEELFRALITDTNRLLEIQHAAEKMHGQKGKPFVPSLTHVRKVIINDFDEASKLKDVPEDRLMAVITHVYRDLINDMELSPTQRDATMQGSLDLLSGNTRSAAVAKALRR